MDRFSPRPEVFIFTGLKQEGAWGKGNVQSELYLINQHKMKSDPHLLNLLKRAPALSSCITEIEKAYDLMHRSLSRGGKLLLCGNGGSASDVEHWAGELLKGFRRTRPLSLEDQSTLPPELSTRLQGALPAIPLTGFPALTTAFGNDVAPELVFAQLVWALGNSGDVFVGISTSGNAKNVNLAAKSARARNLVTIGLTGRNGGQLIGNCDVTICVPENETYLIQEYHLPIYHCLSLMLEEAFFSSVAAPGVAQSSQF